jgi:hypothetical protein
MKQAAITDPFRKIGIQLAVGIPVAFPKLAKLSLNKHRVQLS